MLPYRSDNVIRYNVKYDSYTAHLILAFVESRKIQLSTGLLQEEDRRLMLSVVSCIPRTKGNYMIRRLSVCYLDDKSVVRPKLVFNSNAKDYPIKLKLKQTHS